MKTMEINKVEAYKKLKTAVEAVLGEEKDPVVWMATLSCLIRDMLDGIYWVGFYRAEAGGDLAIGPYQGTLACLRIPKGRGACGFAASQVESVVIPDVEEFSAHISCDSRSRSEIVVPVKDHDGVVRGVLDIDSDSLGRFDEVDRGFLEDLVGLMKRLEWD